MNHKVERFVGAVALVVLSACGGSAASSEQSAGKSSNKDNTPTPTGISADDLGCRYIVAGNKSRATNPGGPTQYLTLPVAESFGCYDKVTFTFAADEDAPPPAEAVEPFTCIPAYTVEYREAPFGLLKPDPATPPEDWKGVSTSTAGFDEAKAVLYVEISPAISVSEYPRKPELAYPGGLRLVFPASEMHHLEIVEWVKNLPEGEQTTATTTTVPGVAPVPQRVVWLIGLDEKRPFTVDCATGPAQNTTCPVAECAHISVLIMK